MNVGGFWLREHSYCPIRDEDYFVQKHVQWTPVITLPMGPTRNERYNQTGL
jgi:hypothetical protein